LLILFFVRLSFLVPQLRMTPTIPWINMSCNAQAKTWTPCIFKFKLKICGWRKYQTRMWPLFGQPNTKQWLCMENKLANHVDTQCHICMDRQDKSLLNQFWFYIMAKRTWEFALSILWQFKLGEWTQFLWQTFC
jgi:hypothetical protein